MRLLALPLFALAACVTRPPTPGTQANPTEIVPYAEAATLPLTFKPLVDRTLIEDSVITRTDGSERESVRATLSSRYAALDGGTWQLSQRMPKVTVERNGALVEDPLMEVVRRMPIDVELDATGKFLQLTSGARIASVVSSVFTRPDQAAVVLQLFKPAVMEEQARREWEAKTTVLLEKPLVKGQPVATQETLALGGGKERPYILRRHPRGWAKTARGRAAVLSFSCEAPPDAGATVSCEGQQVIAADPFVPVLWWMRLRSGEVTLEKTVRLVELKEDSKQDLNQGAKP